MLLATGSCTRTRPTGTVEAGAFTDVFAETEDYYNGEFDPGSG